MEQDLEGPLESGLYLTLRTLLLRLWYPDCCQNNAHQHCIRPIAFVRRMQGLQYTESSEVGNAG